MRIPDYSKTSTTDAEHPPVCAGISPDRKNAAVFVTTLSLVHEVEEEHITKVVWPRQLQKFRQDILRAYDGSTPHFTYSVNPNREVELTLSTKTGDHVDVLIEGAVGLARKLSIAVSKGTCKLTWLVKVEHPEEYGSMLYTCIGADVLLTVTTNDVLPGLEREENEGDEGDDERPLAELDRQAALSMTLSPTDDEGEVLPPEPDPDDGRPRRRRVVRPAPDLPAADIQGSQS